MLAYKDLNENPIKWKPKNCPRENASNNHVEAISLIREMFPAVTVFEECLIPLGIKDKHLYIDIFIPDLFLAIEVDGNQHDKYNPFFHKDKRAFAKQKFNDSLKESWCELNNITLIRLKEKENIDEWRRNIILGAGG